MKLLLSSLIVFTAWSVLGADASEESVKALTRRLMPSLVVVHTLDVSGEVETSGTGFVVDEAGIIATSLHTIPQGRRIEVVFQDRRRLEVEAVHAFDRPTDLALLKVAATNLPALSLGDSAALEQGESVIAIGHPQGHTFSVVEGVVSARRDAELSDMIQLALPTEQGNSGGPVLDRHGVVYGVLAMKHAFQHNVGFAVPINALKPLIENPNPIPMKRWATIGQLNPREWKTFAGARWSQSGGRIMVEGVGTGFGGRSLCISQRTVPEPPYEAAVRVKLDDESGAAGLAFESDGGDVHYGFYPTGGSLRLTRFDGPTVWTWKIIETVQSEHYRPGDWNHLKIRVTKDGIECFVNEHLVIRSDDVNLRGGLVGLAKFRKTEATFAGYSVAETIPTSIVPSTVRDTIIGKIAELDPDAFPSTAIVDQLKTHGAATQSVLAKQATKLEKQAEQLRRLAGWVHTKKIESELVRELSRDEPQIDLLYCALLLSKNDDPELDVEAYRNLVDTMAEELSERIPEDAEDLDRLRVLNDYLFKENGFHGSRGPDYYGSNNSYINRVLDDREGQPITLSVVYLELARRIGVKSLVGANLPGHFMVYHKPDKGEHRLIDVFESGRMSAVRDVVPLGAVSDPPIATKREIVARILRNLVNGAEAGESGDQAARYYELLVEVMPDASFARVRRALARWQAGNIDGARNDLVWLLEHDSPDVNERRVRELLRDLEKK
ncbi:MAG: trypsin-like peptidase domain-containing protein [Verrucomicrobiae bacterium]|nr:trypsin-like peptidase domain-containing protein [Verrucomicrobiae bacterium]